MDLSGSEYFLMQVSLALSDHMCCEFTSSRESLIQEIKIIKAKIHDNIVPSHYVKGHRSTMFLLIEIGSCHDLQFLGI